MRRPGAHQRELLDRSEFDLDHATWPGISYPIVSVIAGAAAEVRSWTLADDRSAFVEEPILEDRDV